MSYYYISIKLIVFRYVNNGFFVIQNKRFIKNVFIRNARTHTRAPANIWFTSTTKCVQWKSWEKFFGTVTWNQWLLKCRWILRKLGQKTSQWFPNFHVHSYTFWHSVAACELTGPFVELDRRLDMTPCPSFRSDQLTFTTTTDDLIGQKIWAEGSPAIQQYLLSRYTLRSLFRWNCQSYCNALTLPYLCTMCDQRRKTVAFANVLWKSWNSYWN